MQVFITIDEHDGTAEAKKQTRYDLSLAGKCFYILLSIRVIKFLLEALAYMEILYSVLIKLPIYVSDVVSVQFKSYRHIVSVLS